MVKTLMEMNFKMIDKTGVGFLYNYKRGYETNIRITTIKYHTYLTAPHI